MDIKVQIKVTKDRGDIDVKFQGFNENLVSYKDREIFKLSKQRVKEAIDVLKNAEEQVDGIKPIAAVATCHTPFSSLFASYSWYDVTRKVKPVNWEVIQTNISEEIIDTKTHFNDTENAKVFNIELMHDQDVYYHSIAVANELGFDSKIDYNFLLPVILSSPVQTASASNISYKSCRDDTLKSVPVGHSNRVMVELEPGMQIVANLKVTRHTYELRVTYKTSLRGEITAKFIDCFKRYKNDYCVRDVLQAADLPTTVFKSQIIKMIFYTDREIVLGMEQIIRSS